MLKDFIETTVKSLVEHSDQVVVEESEEHGVLRYRVQVDPSDRGKVIGKGGRIANALRVVSKAIASKNRERVQIEILTEEE
jgi:predicted RNA-binding protein YlqC (UPF0109 family)